MPPSSESKFRYYAATWLAERTQFDVLNAQGKANRLLSFYHVRASEERESARVVLWKEYLMAGDGKFVLDLFLDSGAYSAFTKGVTISLDEYIMFVHEHKALLTTYANLDVIGDPDATWQNQLEMERQGLQPLPCFHYGEDRAWLKKYMDRYPYFALGGMVPISTSQLIPWLDSLMKTLCDGNGRPVRQFHGFGLTALDLLLRYPWYSVDSTSWVVAGRFGSIYLWVNGKIDPIAVSDKSSSQQVVGRHISTLSVAERKVVLAEIERRGFTLEQLASHYVKRDEWNIRFFCELEDRLQGDRRFVPGAGVRDFFA